MVTTKPDGSLHVHGNISFSADFVNRLISSNRVSAAAYVNYQAGQLSEELAELMMCELDKRARERRSQQQEQ